jgi:hypothetical protein
MKSALVCALLVLVPLSSVRMVCFSTHAAERRTASGAQSAAAGEPDETECQRICTHRPAEPKAAVPAVRCVLLADPACEWLTTAAAAVMPPAPRVASAAGVAPFELPASAEYASPVLVRQSPPPRS